MANNDFSRIVGSIAFKGIKENDIDKVPMLEKFIREHSSMASILDVQDDAYPGWSRKWAEWAIKEHARKEQKKIQKAFGNNLIVQQQAKERMMSVLAFIKEKGLTFETQNKLQESIAFHSKYMYGTAPAPKTFYKYREEWKSLIQSHNQLS